MDATLKEKHMQSFTFISIHMLHFTVHYQSQCPTLEKYHSEAPLISFLSFYVCFSLELSEIARWNQHWHRLKQGVFYKLETQQLTSPESYM